MGLSKVRPRLEFLLQLGPLGHCLLRESTPVRVEEIQVGFIGLDISLRRLDIWLPEAIDQQTEKHQCQNNQECIHC